MGMPTNAVAHLLIAFSWSTSNIGDIAITPGLLSLVREARPDMRAVVMTSQRADSPAFAMLRDYFPRYLPNCGALAYPFSLGSDSSRGAAGSAWRAFHDRWGESDLRAFQNGTISARAAARIADDILDRLPRETLEELRRQNPEAARAFTDAGFVVFSSGTTLNFGRMGVRDLYRFTLRFAMPLLIARAHGIPYGINGQSFEAIDWPADLIFRPLFRDARFVYCRDPDSLEYLRQRDLLCPRSGYRPDSTFFFQGFDDAWAEAFMRAHGLQEGRFITVTIRSARSQPGPLASSVAQEREDAHMASVRAFIEAWIGRTGLPVVLCPEVRTEIETARDQVFARLSPESQKKCVPMDDFWTTEQAYSLYRRAEIVVSMEMHSIIMALSLGTPVLMPQFSENGRKAWMLEELGLVDWLFDIDRPGCDAFLGAALKIHADHPAAVLRVRSQLPHLKQLGMQVITEIETGWRRTGSPPRPAKD